MTETKVKERPILFSAPMVRALLEGRKTQTRRVVKHPRWANKDEPIEVREIDGVQKPFAVVNDGELDLRTIECPYGKPGDRLWVRENFAYSKHNTLFAADVPISEKPQENVPEWDWDATCQNRWRPSIHMPRKLCRIALEITGVRVERVQEISPADCFAEGMTCSVCDKRAERWEPNEDHPGCEDVKQKYADLWKEINGKESWDANPWVWVVEFKRVIA